MIYVIILLCLIIVGILAYLGIKKYNEIHEKLETQRKAIEDTEAALQERTDQLAAKEEYFKQEKDIFDLEKKVFLKSQAAKFDLSEKSEKEIAVELYAHFIQMESEFARYQRGLDALNDKVVGIKDYSEQMDTLTNALCDQFTLYKNNLVTTNTTYTEKLDTLQADVNKTMDTLMTELEDLVSESALKTFSTLNSDVERILTGISDEISQKVLAQLPETLKQEEVEAIVQEAVGKKFEDIMVAIDVKSTDFKKTLKREMSNLKVEEPTMVEPQEALPEEVVENKIEEMVATNGEIPAQPLDDDDDLVLEMLA